MMLPSREDYEPLSSMQVHVQSLLSGPLSGSAVLETSPNSTIGSLVSSFCALKDVCCHSDLVILDCNYQPLALSATLEAGNIQDGATLLLGNKTGDCGNRPATPWGLLGLLAFAIGAGGLITVILLYSLTGGTIPFDYAIVVDAGSTHSQALLYRWSGAKDHGTGDVSQEQSCTVDGGIAQTDDVYPVLNCVESLVHFIPSTSIAHSYLYFGATAGMRLVNLTSPHLAKLIILNLQCALEKAGIAIHSVKIITGQVEGVSSWITTNFLTNSLHPRKGIDMWNNTYGALDMGGASTQYSFSADGAHHANKSDIVNLKLYGYNYSVIAKTYLCYGLSEAFRRHFAMLVEDLNSTKPINDPCLPKGNTTVLTAEYLFNQPCTTTIKFELWLLSNPANMQKKFTFQGESNYQKCRSLVNYQLNDSVCKSMGFKECAEPNAISLSAEKFMAFSGYFYITSFLNSTNSSLEDFLGEIEKWCAKSWSEISEIHFPNPVLKLSLRYCFSGFYVVEWLTGIYNFSQSTWSKLSFVEKIGNTEVGWALGYMVNATNAIPEDFPSLPVLSFAVFIILTVLCGLLLILSIRLLLQYRRNKYHNIDNMCDPLVET